MPQEYAARTRVEVQQTQQQIVTMLRAAGASKVAPMSDYEARREILMFELANRRIRFALQFPGPDDREITHEKNGRRRPAAEARAQMAQVERTKWRKLHLLLKAKLEAVRDGTVSMEEEFLAWTVMPNGQTVGEWAKAQIDHAMLEGHMPPLLPSGE